MVFLTMIEKYMVFLTMIEKYMVFFTILGCSKSFESDIYRAVEEPKFLRHFKISSFI